MTSSVSSSTPTSTARLGKLLSNTLKFIERVQGVPSMLALLIVVFKQREVAKRILDFSDLNHDRVMDFDEFGGMHTPPAQPSPDISSGAPTTPSPSPSP